MMLGGLLKSTGDSQLESTKVDCQKEKKTFAKMTTNRPDDIELPGVMQLVEPELAVELKPVELNQFSLALAALRKTLQLTTKTIKQLF